MKEPNRERKGEIKYNVSLNEEQKLAKKGIYERDVTIILGDYGTGKSLTACLSALDLFFKKIVDKIFITRPINFEATGYLKGNLIEKLYHHTFPIMQNLYQCCNKEKSDKLCQDGFIEVFPIDYMKGITIDNAVLIVDEFEDINFSDFELIISRLGKDSKLIFTGSEEQIDIPNSCIYKIKCLEECNLVNYCTLKELHRNKDIPEILKFIKEHEIISRRSN